jgi:hypothetical protein
VSYKTLTQDDTGNISDKICTASKSECQLQGFGRTIWTVHACLSLKIKCDFKAGVGFRYWSFTGLCPNRFTQYRRILLSNVGDV